MAAAEKKMWTQQTSCKQRDKRVVTRVIFPGDFALFTIVFTYLLTYLLIHWLTYLCVTIYVVDVGLNA